MLLILITRIRRKKEKRYEKFIRRRIILNPSATFKIRQLDFRARLAHITYSQRVNA